ncbi:putative nuclease HARBI1 [Saccostrea cucullata]|uniref:putative nuclease HARBI1 n=1 Tax=Saccostrea cuccullata TaxID=36930 RepID=UPI002ECFD2CC
MPVDVVELNKIKKDFYEIAHFPNTVGAIDCTHIRMKAPTIDEHLYVNRKNYHSINIQGVHVCDSTLKILNIVARWPGSTHDAFIWSNSELKRLFVNGTISEGWLLGDSGYPLRPWLLTPVLNPNSQAEERYNTSHILTRNVIERAFGVLKARFRCLDSSGGTLLYSPDKVCKIFVATAVLHNMCIIDRIPLPEGCDPHDNGHIRAQQFAENLNGDGENVRLRLVNEFFRH